MKVILDGIEYEGIVKKEHIENGVRVIDELELISINKKYHQTHFNKYNASEGL